MFLDSRRIECHSRASSYVIPAKAGIQYY